MPPQTERPDWMIQSGFPVARPKVSVQQKGPPRIANNKNRVPINTPRARCQLEMSVRVLA
jgi:hypothetical protein